jgi:RecJ-like exonuclease
VSKQCEKCVGTGTMPSNYGAKRCVNCNGTGMVPDVRFQCSAEESFPCPYKHEVLCSQAIAVKCKYQMEVETHTPKQPRELPVFRGYTVDERLQEFRKYEYGKEVQHISFEGARGAWMRREYLKQSKKVSQGSAM